MAEIYGWAGKILRINLTDGKMARVDTEKYLPKYVGGLGIALRIMWDEVGGDVKPFDPENKLIFMVGPLTGTLSPSSGRLTAVSKSPHTWPIEHTTRGNMGGHFGAELKFAGYDGIVVEGRASKPVYIAIHDEQVAIREAVHLWGLNTYEVQRQMVKEMRDPRSKAMAIGPTGERLVRTAVIIHGLKDALGQGGFGAVMGSKNLKGIVVRGTGKVKMACAPKELLDLTEYAKSLIAAPLHGILPLPAGAASTTYRARDGIQWVGGPKKVSVGRVDPKDMSRMGLRPHEAERRFAGKMAAFHVKNTACFSCPVACKSYMSVPGVGPSGIPTSGEFVCLSATWYSPPSSSHEATFAAKQLIDTLGLNPWDLGMWISLLRWMHESGKITEKEAGIPFSDEKLGGERFITTLCNKVAYREGLGDVMAEGLPRGAMKLGVLEDVLRGGAAPKVMLCSHGMCDHYDPRSYSQVLSLTWAMDNRDPNRHEYPGMVLFSGGKIEDIKTVAKELYGSEQAVDPVGKITPYHPSKGKFAIAIDHRGILKDSLPVCDWVFPIVVSPHPEKKFMGDTSIESKLFSAVTGIKWGEKELDHAAERCWNLHRAITLRDWKTINLRESHDVLPPVYFAAEADRGTPTAVPTGAAPGLDRQDFEKAKTDYYRQRGWEEKTGAPTRRRLEELDLKDVADKLSAAKLLPD
jgi:aldehyde:ferredoxin oxidoreductase